MRSSILSLPSYFKRHKKFVKNQPSISAKILDIFYYKLLLLIKICHSNIENYDESQHTFFQNFFHGYRRNFMVFEIVNCNNWKYFDFIDFICENIFFLGFHLIIIFFWKKCSQGFGEIQRLFVGISVVIDKKVFYESF